MENRSFINFFHPILTSVLRVAQVDRPLAYALLGNMSSLFFGPITIYLIATYLSPELQGYYFTFGSLISIQLFIELGLGQTLIQFASHEWSKLCFKENGHIVGNTDSRSRLISLGRLSFKWYSASATMVILVFTPIGYLFFNNSLTGYVEWQWPWVSLCFLLGLNLLLMPIFYLLQGCNEVSAYWFYRFIQQILYALALCIAIIVGAGLWTLPIASAIVVIWSLYFICRYYFKFFLFFLSRPFGPRISWVRDIWPVQWRISLSWLSTNFTPLFFAPILFYFSSPYIAGQMGMTVSLSSILLAFSSNWLVTRAPRFGMLVAQGKYTELDHLFSTAFRVSLLVVCSAVIVFMLLSYILNGSHHALSFRILPPLSFGLLLVGTGISLISTNISVYLRSHKREPLVFLYLLGAILILTSSTVLARPYGALGVSGSYCAVALVQGPISLLFFLRFRTRMREIV